MIGIDAYVLLDFDIVDGLEQCKAVSDTGNAHFLEVLVLHLNKGIPVDRLLCVASVLAAALPSTGRWESCIPINKLAY